MSIELKKAAQQAIEALIEARRYVVGAYECAFPDRDLNESVIRQIDEAVTAIRQAEVTDAALIRELVDHIERNTCTHEETHRGGAIWEVCDSCGARWADDEGGKPEFKWPAVVEKARAILALRPAAAGMGDPLIHHPTPAVPDIEAAAKKLAECMDYPWEHMPEKGRANMRKHAASVLTAAQAQKGQQ